MQWNFKNGKSIFFLLYVVYFEKNIDTKKYLKIQILFLEKKGFEIHCIHRAEFVILGTLREKERERERERAKKRESGNGKNRGLLWSVENICKRGHWSQRLLLKHCFSRPYSSLEGSTETMGTQ